MKTTQCNKCDGIYSEDELVTVEDMKACSHCKTDEFLIDLELDTAPEDFEPRFPRTDEEERFYAVGGKKIINNNNDNE